MKTAVYAGTFDPLTKGHLDIIQRAGKLFDRVIVVAMVNSSKSTLFTLEERLLHLRDSVAGLTNGGVDHSDKLAVDYARSVNATTFVRGIRNEVDYRYEWPVATMNADLEPEIDTVFILARPKNEVISSSIVKEIALYGQAVDSYVPAIVAEALQNKFKKVTE